MAYPPRLSGVRRQEAWRLSRCSWRWRGTARRSRPATLPRRFGQDDSDCRIAHLAGRPRRKATVRVVDADIETKRQQIFTKPDAASLESLRTIALDILVWRRFRGQWSDELPDELKRAAVDVMVSGAIIGDVLDAAA